MATAGKVTKMTRSAHSGRFPRRAEDRALRTRAATRPRARSAGRDGWWTEPPRRTTTRPPVHMAAIDAGRAARLHRKAFGEDWASED